MCICFTTNWVLIMKNTRKFYYSSIIGIRCKSQIKNEFSVMFHRIEQSDSCKLPLGLRVHINESKRYSIRMFEMLVLENQGENVRIHFVNELPQDIPCWINDPSVFFKFKKIELEKAFSYKPRTHLFFDNTKDNRMDLIYSIELPHERIVNIVDKAHLFNYRLNNKVIQSLSSTPEDYYESLDINLDLDKQNISTTDKTFVVLNTMSKRLIRISKTKIINNYNRSINESAFSNTI